MPQCRKKANCTYVNNMWQSQDEQAGRPCLPKCLFPFYARLADGKDHVSKGGVWMQKTNTGSLEASQMTNLYSKSIVQKDLREQKLNNTDFRISRVHIK